MFLQTSLSSHVTDTAMFFLAGIKQFLSDVSWSDLDYHIIDRSPGMMTIYMLFSEACDVLMCEVQWPSDPYHPLWINSG